MCSSETTIGQLRTTCVSRMAFYGLDIALGRSVFFTVQLSFRERRQVSGHHSWLRLVDTSQTLARILSDNPPFSLSKGTGVLDRLRNVLGSVYRHGLLRAPCATVLMVAHLAPSHALHVLMLGRSLDGSAQCPGTRHETSRPQSVVVPIC